MEGGLRKRVGSIQSLLPYSVASCSVAQICRAEYEVVLLSPGFDANDVVFPNAANGVASPYRFWFIFDSSYSHTFACSRTCSRTQAVNAASELVGWMRCEAIHKLDSSLFDWTSWVFNFNVVYYSYRLFYLSLIAERSQRTSLQKSDDIFYDRDNRFVQDGWLSENSQRLTDRGRKGG